MLSNADKASAVFETSLPLKCLNRGKVRDIYEASDDSLLIVTTDRLSAFDVVLPNPIESKGKVLTQISKFWFEKFKEIVPNHIITFDVKEMGLPEEVVNNFGSQLEGRSMLVKKAKPLPVECIVRGYVTGSGWKDYQKTGKICGHELPEGLGQCQQLPEPIFTPSTKADEGHDENIDRDQARALVGAEVAEKIERLSIEIYKAGAEFAQSRGILIADTKFEFGLRGDELILIDEVLTPDSSRFWPQEQYEVGRDQPSYDKQIVRNYLAGLDWDKTPPGPELPAEISDKTSRAYIDVYERLTESKFEA